MGGQPDHIAHRQQGAGSGDGLPGGVFELVQGGGHDDGDGQAVMRPQFAGGQDGAAHRQQRVVGALLAGAPVPAGHLRVRVTVHPR